MSDNTHSRAVDALKLHAAYEAVPGDRGGANGPKGKALAVWIAARDAVLADLPAVSDGDDDGPCTDCWDTGITIQTERKCSCGAGDPAPSDQEKLAKGIEAELQRWEGANGGVYTIHAASLAIAEQLTRAVSTEGWQPIETAPKDGTTIDVWRDGSRETVYWGGRPHECGEMGHLCDSDWHSEKQPGWVCSTFGEFVGGKHDPFTHWMPIPAGPGARTSARQTSSVVSGEGWQPIDTAPKDGWYAPILTCCVGDPVAWFDHEPVAGYAQPPSTAYWNEHGDCWTPCQRPHDVWEPTHWMPLPAVPVIHSEVAS